MYAQGRVRAIGVSNFQPDHLDRLLAGDRVVPAVESDRAAPVPAAGAGLRRYDADHGLATVAWSPLGQATSIADPVIGARSPDATGRTPAQVILRWHLAARAPW